jgi:hypothetical protein
MARGQPDYNVPEYTFFSIETPNSDLFSERMGFSRLDNRGRILWVDDFRNGINRWKVANDNGGANPIHFFQTPFVLGYNGSVKINSQVNTGISEFFSDLILPVSRIMGFEVGLYLPSNYAQVEIVLSHKFSTSFGKGANLFITPATGEIVLHNGAGDHSVFTPSAIADLTNRWVVIKVVADFSTGKYVRVMIGNTQYDVSNLDLDTGNIGLVGATQIEVATLGTSATNKEPVYVGYVIISGDEP